MTALNRVSRNPCQPRVNKQQSYNNFDIKLLFHMAQPPSAISFCFLVAVLSSVSQLFPLKLYDTKSFINLLGRNFKMMKSAVYFYCESIVGFVLCRLEDL